MRLVTTWLVSTLCLASFVGVLGAANHASADASVIVLGLRSVEGDDDVANAVTDALRDAAHGVPGWQLLDRALSMAQMSLAHGCDDIDASCLSEIAKGLAVDRVVYGTVRRTSARAEYDYQLALSIFDASSGSMGSTETDIIPRGQAENPETLRPRAASLLGRLSGAGGGSLAIQVNVGTAEVRLDGQVVGQTRDHVLVLEGVAPGEHQVDIRAVGYGTFSQRVNVSSTGQSSVIATVSSVPAESAEEPGSQSNAYGTDATPHKKSLRWLGYTLLGVGGASLIGVAASWLVINGVNGNATFTKYSDRVSKDVPDICATAKAGMAYGASPQEVKDVVNMCRRGSTFEVLQWVFLGTALVSGGIGAYVLVTDKERTRDTTNADARATASTFALTPSFGRGSASLSARLAF